MSALRLATMQIFVKIKDRIVTLDVEASDTMGDVRKKLRDLDVLKGIQTFRLNVGRANLKMKDTVKDQMSILVTENKIPDGKSSAARPRFKMYIAGWGGVA